MITEHERQLREQRAQLGALQEAADEHEANHALLRQQKKSLKDAAEALGYASVEAWRRAEQYITEKKARSQ